MAESAAPGAATAPAPLAQGHPPAGVARVEEEIAILLRRSRAISMSIAAKVHPDLQSAAYTVLRLVDEQQEVRGVELASRLGLDKSTVSRVVTHLRELGLVDAGPDSSDGRARIIRLTPLGRTRLHEARAERRTAFVGYLSQWDPHELDTFATLLHRLNDDLS